MPDRFELYQLANSQNKSEMSQNHRNARAKSAEESVLLAQTLTKMHQEIEQVLLHFKHETPSRLPNRHPLLKPWLTNNLLMISFMWQALNIIVLHIAGAYSDSGTVPGNPDSAELSLDIGLGVMIIFQSVHLLL